MKHFSFMETRKEGRLMKNLPNFGPIWNILCFHVYIKYSLYHTILCDLLIVHQHNIPLVDQCPFHLPEMTPVDLIIRNKKGYIY